MHKLTKCSWYIHNHNCHVILFHFSHFDIKFCPIHWKKVNRSIYDSNCQLRMREILGGSGWINQSDSSLHVFQSTQTHYCIAHPSTFAWFQVSFSVYILQKWRWIQFSVFQDFDAVFHYLSIKFNTIPDRENPLFIFNTFSWFPTV